MRTPGEGGDDPRIGTTIAGRYFVHRVLGRGGMGDVYEATRLADDRAVALKILRASADEERVRRFEREAEAAARLRDPGAVEVLGSGRDDDGTLFLVLERVAGRDLARVLREEGALPPARAARIADAILSLLSDAHAAGVLHRDLKPANVMVVPSGDGSERVKVLDFGIATFLEDPAGEERLTREGVVHGTPAYMSPEQIRGEPLDARTDLYAVGALLFEMIAGAPPFEAPSPMAIAARQLTEAAPALRRAPPLLAALVARALERDRERRPASAAAMREALRDAVAGLRDAGPAAPRPLPPTEALPVEDVARAASPRRRRAAAAALLGAGVIVAAIAIGVRGARGGADGRAVEGAAYPGSTATSTSTPTPTATSIPTAISDPPAGPRLAGPIRTGAPATARPASRSVAGPRRAAAELAAAPAAAPPIRLVRGELNAIPTPPAGTGDGVLVLQATPWAVVSVGGSVLGEAPREVRLGAGTYDVRAVHPDLGTRDERVTVRAGERTLWSATFKE